MLKKCLSFQSTVFLCSLPAVILAAAATGCGNDTTGVKPDPGTRVLLVVNSLNGTLDRIDLANGHVTKGALALGDMPNDVVVDPVRHVFYVANSGDNDVWKIDVATDSVLKRIPLGPNSNPYLLRLLSDGNVAVSNLLAGDVARLDVAAGSVIDRTPVGLAPEGLLENAGQILVTVTNLNSTDYHYGTGEVVRLGGPRRVVGTDPQALLGGPDGKLHVVCTGNSGWYEPASYGEVWVLNPTTLAVEDTIPIGGSPGFAAVSGNSVYLSGWTGGLMKYDGLTHTLTRGPANPVLAKTGLQGLTADPEEHRLYVAGFNDDAVYVIDTRADTLLATWNVGDGPTALAVATVPDTAK